MVYNTWTEEQESELVRLYREEYSAGAAADLLDRDPSTVSNKIQKLLAAGRMERRPKTTVTKRVDHGPRKTKPPAEIPTEAPAQDRPAAVKLAAVGQTDRVMLTAARLIKTLGSAGFRLIELKFTNIEDTELIVGVNSYEH